MRPHRQTPTPVRMMGGVGSVDRGGRRSGVVILYARTTVSLRAGLWPGRRGTWPHLRRLPPRHSRCASERSGALSERTHQTGGQTGSSGESGSSEKPPSLGRVQIVYSDTTELHLPRRKRGVAQIRHHQNIGSGTCLACCTTIKDSEIVWFCHATTSRLRSLSPRPRRPRPPVRRREPVGMPVTLRASCGGGCKTPRVVAVAKRLLRFFWSFPTHRRPQGRLPLPPHRSSAERPTPVGSCGRVAGMRGAPSATTRAIAGGWGGRGGAAAPRGPPGGGTGRVLHRLRA